MNPRTRSRIISSIGSNHAASGNAGNVPGRSLLSFVMGNLHRRLTAESGSFHKPEITPPSISTTFATGPEGRRRDAFPNKRDAAEAGKKADAVPRQPTRERAVE